MKRSVRAWWSLAVLLAGAVCSLGADTVGRAERLEKLKAEFPAHVAGAMTEKTDSTVRACYFKFKRLTDRLTDTNLADELAELRKAVDSDLYFLNRLKAHDDERSPATRTARRQNEAWLRQRVGPYVARLERLLGTAMSLEPSAAKAPEVAP